MKIGLFGGAFDPVHNGHVAVMSAALNAGIDRLILIPTGNPPHKNKSSVTDEDRLKMLSLAAANKKNVTISSYELEKEGVSYSADTAEHFSRLFPKDELFFIIGDDSYRDFGLWHEPERIMKVCTLLVFPRAGEEVLPPAVKMPMKKVEISSSEIRKKIKCGMDISGAVPEGVLNYIYEKKLYMD